MKPDKPVDASVLGKLFSRTPISDEISPTGWQGQISDILGIATTANTILCIHATEGAGKTTFLRHVSIASSEYIDTVILNPSAPTAAPGWISMGIAQWLTSDYTNHKNFQSKLAALKDANRPILICIDGGEFLNPQQLSSEMASLVNFADASGLKLSVLVSSSPERAELLSREAHVATRIIFNKVLEPMTDSELTEIIIRKIRLNKSLEQLISAKDLPPLARQAGGVPIRMIHLVCQHLGLNLPKKQQSLRPSLKQAVGKAEKKTNDESSTQLDDLLAPQSK